MLAAKWASWQAAWNARATTRESSQPDEERIAYHEKAFDEMRDIFLLESLRCAGLNNCEPALWMGICRSAMKRLSNLCLPMRESGEREAYSTMHVNFLRHGNSAEGRAMFEKFLRYKAAGCTNERADELCQQPYAESTHIEDGKDG